jgi:hypothetical protein
MYWVSVTIPQAMVRPAQLPASSVNSKIWRQQEQMQLNATLNAIVMSVSAKPKPMQDTERSWQDKKVLDISDLTK